MRRVADNIPPMKQQFVVIRTVRQTEIPALLDGLQAHLLPVLRPQNSSHFLKKNMTCLNAGLLMNCHVFLSSLKLCIARLRQIAVS
jgi:hypothetical protein